MRIVWGAAFAVFYCFFATATWQWVLLPGHWIMGAVHGAIVNWSGHSTATGTSTSTTTRSNTLPLDFLTAGELFQNNHHKFPMSPNFAARWFEIDTTYQVMRLFNWLGIIDMSRSQKMRWAPAPAVSPPAAG